MQDQYEILTDRGPAAIAVVRLRGRNVPRFLAGHVRASTSRVDAAALEPGAVLRVALLDQDQPIDDALLSVHRAAPDWDVRLHLHGGRWIVRRCAELLEAAGFEPSPQPHPLWPAADAVEAEAHALLPRMRTLAGAVWLLRQAAALPAAIRELRDRPCSVAAGAALRAVIDGGAILDWYAAPARIALVGPPNAGKSTLANALAGRDAALVSPTPGTTRDWLEIPAEMGGFPAVWLDTAGLRPAEDPLEAAGIERTHRVMAGADAVVIVLDSDPAAFESQRAFADRYAADRPACVLLNKSDRYDALRRAMLDLAARWPAPALAVSAAQGAGVNQLASALLHSLGRDRENLDAPSAFTERQRDALRRATIACDAANEPAFRAALDGIL